MKVAGAVALGAASYLVLSIALNGDAIAQTASGPNPPGNSTALSPIIVQGNSQKRAKAHSAATPQRTRVISLRANRGRGTAQSRPASAGAHAAETAWGHVDGYMATRSASGTKTDTALIETPQAISIVTQDQIRDQRALNVGQALDYSSGVNGERGGVNTSGFEFIQGRGFQLEKYLDGMRLPNVTYNVPSYEVYNLERIEVLHGPASVLYGQGYPGGQVNLVSKRPTDTPFGEINVSAGTYDLGATSFDLGGPADKDGTLLYRLTGLFRNNDTQVDNTREQRFSIAPAVTWKPDANTTFTVLANYQNDPSAGYYNLLPAVGTVLPNPNGKISPSFNPGEPGFDQHSREQYGIGYLFEHRFDDVLTIRQSLRYTDIHDDLQNVFASFFGLDADNRTLNRYGFYNNESLNQLTTDNQAQLKFLTGPVAHTAIFGLDYQHINYNELYNSYFAAPSIDVFNPVYGAAIAKAAPSGSDDAHLDQLGLYAQDQMSLGNWRFMISGRQDWAKSDDYDYVNNILNSKESDKAFTWRTGLVYLFDNGVAPYASYATSFQPQVGTDFSGSAFKPTTAEQYEVGLKYQPVGWNSFVTAALFDLTQQNVLTTDSAHPTFSVQTGAIRSRGLELEWHANLNKNLEVIAAYTYLDNIVTQANDTDLQYGLDVGTHPVGVPRNAASLWTKYSFRDGPANGLALGGGVRFVGETYGTNTNVWDNVPGLSSTPSIVPGYTLFDALVSYDFGAKYAGLKGFSATVNARNLFDKTYVAYCQSVVACQYGLGRTVIGTLAYRW
jgi:iron complex outermembrane recepter protein